MMGATPTPRQEGAQGRIHELPAELVEIIGPHGDGQADYDAAGIR